MIHHAPGSSTLTAPEYILPTERPLRDAAVLVPLYRDDEGELRLVLIRRGEGGAHGGQLAFPGGKRDPGETLLETVLREVHEEVGLPSEAVQVLAELEPFETRSTGFRIHPFLAKVQRPKTWIVAADEVAEVLEPPLAAFGPQSHATEEWQLEGWPRSHTISYYRIGEHHLWGATYRIFHPLLPRLRAGEWAL